MALLRMEPVEMGKVIKACFISRYEDFKLDELISSIQKSWHFSILVAALYLVAVYSAQSLVKRKYNIKWMLVVWNAGLALFSIVGTCHITYYLMSDLFYRGFDATVCDRGFFREEARPSIAYFLLVFCMSKFPELFDTAFLILRKAPLQFLHTYHHATVLIFSIHLLTIQPAACFWYSGMNYFVHAVMYTYFCIRALRIYVPERLAKAITSMQSLQMFVGLVVNFYSLYRKWNGHYCGNTYSHSIAAIALYLSYFILFLQFYFQRYNNKTQTSSVKDKSQ